MWDSKRDTDVKNRLLDCVGEEEGGMIWENSIETCIFSSVQSLSCVRFFASPWITACQASLSITNSWSWLRLMPIESVMPSSHLILCCPLLLPSIFPSSRVFYNEWIPCIRWPKYWSFSFSISPSTEYSGLISFRMDCLDFLAVRETLKSLLKHHSSKASILWCSDFLIVQLSHDSHMTTGKIIALITQAFVSKVMSLLFNMLSRLVIAFLLGSKRLLISWLQSPSAVILEPKKIKSLTVPLFPYLFPMKWCSYSHKKPVLVFNVWLSCLIWLKFIYDYQKPSI